MTNLSVAFIGAVGVPNNYGGFEMFLESCAPGISANFRKVFITCDAARYPDRTNTWRGLHRVFIPVSANGALSVLHDLLAFFSVGWRADCIIVLGVSGGVFFPLFRLFCALFGKKLIVNVDGVEWRRVKFSRTRRWFLYVSDRFAQKFSHKVIVDNEGLRPFLLGSVRESAVLIAYSGDHVTRMTRSDARRTNKHRGLTICRIEPENNCHLLIEAFALARNGTYTFIGNWNASEYGRNLRARYSGLEGLEMRDPVYDKTILASLREECTLYLHGHSVGGTNPSLVEMLFYDCEIVAFDCVFNRYTADDAIHYFADQNELAARISGFGLTHDRDRTAVRLRYTEARICNAYTHMIEEACQPGRLRRRPGENAVGTDDVDLAAEEVDVGNAAEQLTPVLKQPSIRR